MIGSSRDDFPVNAFALLPPSSVMDITDVPDAALSIALHADAPVAVESVAEVENLDNKELDWARRIQVFHSEQRGVIEALYSTIETLNQDNDRLRQECARVNGSLERSKVEEKANTNRLKQQLCEQDTQILQLQETVRLNERTQVCTVHLSTVADVIDAGQQRLVNQVADVNAAIKDKETTISTLQAAIREQESKQQTLQFSGSRGELQRVSELWTAKERAVDENTNQIRQSVSAMQRLGEQLQLELQQVQAELTAAESDHAIFREFIGEYQQQQEQRSSNPTTVNSADLQALDTQTRARQTLERKVIVLENKNKTLCIKCTELEESVKLLTSLQAELREQNEKSTWLIAKYEASARDGTETIAELHESLVKLCEQLSEERKTNNERLNDQVQAAVEKERVLMARVEDADDRTTKARGELEVVLADQHICQNCKQLSTSIAQAAVESVANSDATTEHHGSLEQEAIAPAPIKEPATKPDGANSVSGITHHRETPQPISLKKVASRLPTATCGGCHEETFGFMLRCQKCKDPYHAGCVKNDGSGTRKRLGHIFKCNNCAPQRPTKVSRSSGQTDAASSASSTLRLEGRTIDRSRNERS